MKSRILLVDDEKSICEVISLQLKEEGYDVTVAYDGAEALEKVPTFLPDVIVSDIAMPDMNGIELCRLIKDSEKTRFIPFIIMTSLMDRAKHLEALEAGCDEFLNKPIDTVEMFTRLKALIRVKKLILQVVLGGLAGAALVIKAFYRHFINFFKKPSKKEEQPASKE